MSNIYASFHICCCVDLCDIFVGPVRVMESSCWTWSDMVNIPMDRCWCCPNCVPQPKSGVRTSTSTSPMKGYLLNHPEEGLTNGHLKDCSPANENVQKNGFVVNLMCPNCGQHKSSPSLDLCLKCRTESSLSRYRNGHSAHSTKTSTGSRFSSLSDDHYMLEMPASPEDEVLTDHVPRLVSATSNTPSYTNGCSCSDCCDEDESQNQVRPSSLLWAPQLPRNLHRRGALSLCCHHHHYDIIPLCSLLAFCVWCVCSLITVTSLLRVHATWFLKPTLEDEDQIAIFPMEESHLPLTPYIDIAADYWLCVHYYSGHCSPRFIQIIHWMRSLVSAFLASSGQPTECLCTSIWGQLCQLELFMP